MEVWLGWVVECSCVLEEYPQHGQPVGGTTESLTQGS